MNNPMAAGELILCIGSAVAAIAGVIALVRTENLPKPQVPDLDAFDVDEFHRNGIKELHGGAK